MCRTLGRVLVVGALFALILPGLIPVVLLAPTSEVMTTEAIGINDLSISSHIMTSREVEDLNSSIGVRQDGTNYNILIDGHGTGLAPPSSEELTGMVGNAKVTDSVSLTGLTASSSYDISAQPYFPIVGDQGAQGSCAAWAMTYYAYGYEEAKDNGWTDASTGNPAHLMSPAWTYNMIAGGTASGTFMDTNAAVITSWGVATLAKMPYVASDVSSWGSQAAFLEAPLHRALSYSTLSYSSATTVSSIKALVASNVPVTFAMDASQYTTGLNGDNLITADQYTTGVMNHAQCIVGYSDNMTEAGHSDVGAFKVVNSWGTSFGNKGYYWISYATINKIGASGLLYATYITDRPSYQPSLLATWQFSTAPTRNSAITVGIGTVGSTTKISPYFMPNIGSATAKFPTFMALDITSLGATYAAGTTSFYLTIGKTNTAGVISSFKIQQYANGYSSGATKISGQSPNVPLANPCSVTVSLPASSSTTTIPGVPTAVSATAGSSSVTMVWTAPASNGGSAITGYYIYRGTATGQETLLSSAASTAASFSDMAVSSGTTYYYQVAAVNAIGTSSRSTEVSAKVTTTLTVPGAPTLLTAKASGTSAYLTWTAPANNGGSAITSYSIYRGTAAGSESTMAIGTSATTTYSDSTVVTGSTYYYVVKAINSVGGSPASNEASYTISSVPSAPGNLTAAPSSGKVFLSWTAPASSGSSAVTGYSVFRGVSSALTDQTSIGTVAATSYVDPLTTVGTYYYTVRAANAVGLSVASTPISVVIKAVTTVPGIVSGVTAVGTNGAIIVSWSAPANNGGLALAGYRLYRSTVSGSETLLATVGTTTSYNDSGLTNGRTYFYRVSALNALGEGSLGPEVSAVPYSDLPGSFVLSASVSTGVVVLSWTMPSSTSPLQYFQVMRTDSGTETILAKVTPTRTTIIDTTTLSGKEYTYRIVAYNSAGATSTPSVTVTAIGNGIGDGTALNVGSASQDLILGQLGLLLVILIGTIGSVSYIRSRKKNDR